MKKIAMILLLASLVLAGCGRKAPAAEPTPTAAATAVPADETPVPAEMPASPDPAVYAPTGTWVDDSHPEAGMVIDDRCAASISVKADDRSVTVWTFSGVYDPDSGNITYTDCVKQTTAADGTVTTAYTDGTGGLASLDGYLYWTDDVENAGAGYRFRQAL